MKLTIPDISERNRLARLHAEASQGKLKLRVLRHACGHTQSHIIRSDSGAREAYRQVAKSLCGTCQGFHQ